MLQLDKRLLDENAIMQICFVTDDLEKSLAWFSDLTGKTPSHIGKAADHDEAKAVYHGKPADVSLPARDLQVRQHRCRVPRAGAGKERLARPARREGPGRAPHRLQDAQHDQARQVPREQGLCRSCRRPSSTARTGATPTTIRRRSWASSSSCWNGTTTWSRSSSLPLGPIDSREVVDDASILQSRYRDVP